MAGKWDFDTTIKFIQLYKLHPCLWDFSSKDYKNKQKRDAAYITIIEEMNISGFSVTDVKNKINNLRSTYSQEIKKIQDSKKSGAGLDNVYISNIKWLNEMEEVFAKNLKKQVFENVNQANNEVSESQENDFISVAVSSQDTPTNIEVPTSTPTTSTVGKTPRTKKRTRDIVKAISDLKKINDDANFEEETQWDAFGKSIAMQLKTMSVENALLAQCQLQRILTEFGLKDHREKNSSSSAMSNYSDRRASSVLSDNTHISYNNSPDIYLEQCVTSPPQPQTLQAAAPEQTVFAATPTRDQSTSQIINISSHAMDSSPTQQFIYTTQTAIAPVVTASPSAVQNINSDDNIINAAMKAASALELNF
ncbi:hypothetical protein ACJJTC_010529 [Scirpophaga incertulas]